MSILNQYVRRALEIGLIDEWHIWDLTRTASDHEWLNREFGPVRFMKSAAAYQRHGKLDAISPFRARISITNDLHLAVLPKNDPDHFYEIVVGGWSNAASALRRLPRERLKNLDRDDVQQLWMSQTPSVLSPGKPNEVVLSIESDGTLAVFVNGATVGAWTGLALDDGAEIMLRGGWGGDLELPDVKAPIRRYIGDTSARLPYWHAYAYYAKHITAFEDSLFLKCDDDIVYMDLEKLAGFIEFRRRNPNYFVVSANVVNNGVCAYLQQLAGSLPTSVGEFENPPGGHEGTLWGSAAKATALHDYVLQQSMPNLPLPSPVIEWDQRQSINFIAWMGRDIQHLALGPCDDEHAVTVSLPRFLNRKTAIYSDFTVSHLSFGPQESGLNVDDLTARYHALMERQLGSQKATEMPELARQAS
ncbi:hypothetical protein [Rhizobium oryzicola]|uniref:Farnesoic acid O-methyl transferase domain-containing protein n=1 Tax=Rhizobium oryzicola TaxID=1232668 RepID=A0ABT8T150_9HYPH|nr:hypothetical protein [Rhizobium oryzicola]MDO1584447.1 hypothetical protein [Rhizobium oryzicola]